MTMFCPLTITGGGKFVLQTAAEPRFMVDCNANPVALVGQVKIIFGPEGKIVSCGWLASSEMLKIVPLPELPPIWVVP